MFLYEARARASYRNISCTIGTPLLAAFSLTRVTRENRVFKPKKNPGNKTWVGKGAPARPASAAGPKYAQYARGSVEISGAEQLSKMEKILDKIWVEGLGGVCGDSWGVVENSWKGL